MVGGCNNTTSPQDLMDTQHFSSQVTNKLRDWKLNNQVTVNLNDSIALIAIHYTTDISDTLSPYFLDRESNDLIVTMLSYFFYEEMKELKSIVYQLTFENHSDTILVSFSSRDLEMRYKEFEKYPIFYDFVEYAFKNMRYRGVLEATQLMRFLESNTNVFDHKGSFWNLLHDYSKACQHPKDHIYSAYLFIWFTGVANDPDMKHSDNYRQSLLYFVKSCGFKEELVFLRPEELIKQLNSAYGKSEE